MDFNHLKNLQKVFDKAVKDKKVAGLNCIVVKDNNEIGYWQSGFSDIQNKKAFSRDTICRLYSMTKPVTSVAAWILIERGVLDLKDDISSFIPQFKDQNCIITVQDLLNMTSGYTYGAFNPDATEGEKLTSKLIEKLNDDCLNKSDISTLEVAKSLAKIPVSFCSGTDYAYGLSADILGAMIETVSGMKFSDFLKREIFDPLGMVDTGFYVPDNNQHRLSCVYSCDGRSNPVKFEKPNLGIQPFMNHPPSFESGGSGLCSTIDDYLKFCLMLVNGGEYNGKCILQRKTVEYLSTAHLSDKLQKKFEEKMPHFAGYSYCNLMRVAVKKGECFSLTENGEFGWDGWLGPYMSVDLKNKLVIVMLMQKTDAGTWEVTRKMKNIVYSSL
ncbi:MAG: beta-lactamase family protein [Treponema sp.]|nr:beta-lactamase family protein [Treponema sp.]